MAAKVPEAGSQNRVWYYARKPTSPQEQVASKIFEYKDVPGGILALKDGDFMCRTLAVGIAPHAICFLDLPGSDTGAEMSGLERCKVGESIKSEWVGEIIASKSKKWPVGERVSCFSELGDYAVLNENQKTPPPNKIPPFLQTENVLGMGAALTAHMVINRNPYGSVDDGDGCCGLFAGVKKLFGKLSGKPVPQKTVLVTTAAGGVGSMAGQLYKDKGCKVIGVTSSREKADRLLGVGFDKAIAYRTEDMDERLGELAPEGIDVFFDNAGGEHLDAGTKHMKKGGKIVQVGCSSEIPNYCTGKMHGWLQYHTICARELRIGGFLLTNHLQHIPATAMCIMFLLWRGRIKFQDTVIRGGLDSYATSVDKLSTGAAFGRLVLMVEGSDVN
mmetsp:Transcript_139243/g.277631  ORF Transcript_139243/g.277631 Transcript_139243/m.277631 type:complete len:388 (+) Transcript_139243:34-1197(+)|eukprot:CAMPEP_0172887974 /NCGR_PEP_ID=MMETSP1075-20121228/135308_1 /TAXON_ID=2916 /ORGANISM="Ceratium fusus, Strain PA161109" /LENGTH=387 /DNA_ID=CAMNT_0013741763 /DNA_START=30 /DNA_END=1193 /DNA_ORIENTATION=-